MSASRLRGEVELGAQRACPPKRIAQTNRMAVEEVMSNERYCAGNRAIPEPEPAERRAQIARHSGFSPAGHPSTRLNQRAELVASQIRYHGRLSPPRLRLEYPVRSTRLAPHTPRFPFAQRVNAKLLTDGIQQRWRCGHEFEFPK